MCGIIAVVRKRSERPVPVSADVLSLVQGTTAEVESVALADALAPLEAVGARLHEADRLLRGTPGLRVLLSDTGLGEAIRSELSAFNVVLDGLESQLDAQATVDSLDLETVNAALISVRDAAWNLSLIHI